MAHRNGRLRHVWEALRESYWFVPLCLAVVAAAASLGLVEVDGWLRAAGIRPPSWIERTSAEGARAVLTVIASSTITVTGVVFSITIVALTLASSQFGPRLLRAFLRDRGHQLVLGTFVATFLYSLLVLRSIENGAVPHLSVAGAMVLAVASVFVLIYFLHHSARSIQASSIVGAVAREAEGQLRALFPTRLGDGADHDEDVAKAEGLQQFVGRDHRVVAAGRSGYVRMIDQRALLAAAVAHDLRVELRVRPGDFVHDGAALALAAPGAAVDGDLGDRLLGMFVLGDHPTAVQDLGFLVDQLAEMAVRALSPGVNDPGTAVCCIHRLGAILHRLAGQCMPPRTRLDGAGRPRIVTPATSFDEFVGRAFDPIQRYGMRDASVALAVLGALAAVAADCPVAARGIALRERARQVGAAAREHALGGAEQQRLDAAVARIDAP